jgi:hypothetical protein
LFFQCTYLQEAKEHRLLLLNQKRRNLPIPVDSVGAVLPVAVASGQSLLDLLSEYGQDSESETPSSPHPNSEEPEMSQQTPAEPWFYAADEKERELTAVTVHALQLRRQVRQLLAKQHQTANALAQAQADLAREKLHSDLRIGIKLRRRDPRIGGLRNGQVVYAAPQETLASAHVRNRPGLTGTTWEQQPAATLYHLQHACGGRGWGLPISDHDWTQGRRPHRPALTGSAPPGPDPATAAGASTALRAFQPTRPLPWSVPSLVLRPASGSSPGRTCESAACSVSPTLATSRR